MPDTTSRLALPSPALTETADVPRDIRALALKLDNAAIVDQGTIAGRPTSTPGSPGIRGRFYWATDTGVLWHDNGTGWNAIGPGVIAAGQVGTTELADSAVTSAKIANGTIVDADVAAAAALDGAKLADAGVTAAKLSAALKPSQGAAGATEALRALGTAAGTAAAGAHAAQHARTGADPLPADSVTLAQLATQANAGLAQESFFAQLAGGQNLGSRGNRVIWDTEIWDYANRLANGIFTAGRAGVYLFAWAVDVTVPTGNWFESRLNTGGTYGLDYCGSRIYGAVTNRSVGTAMVRMAVNDTAIIDFMADATNSYTANRNAGDGASYGSFFCGSLVGTI